MAGMGELHQRQEIALTDNLNGARCLGQFGALPLKEGVMLRTHICNLSYGHFLFFLFISSSVQKDNYRRTVVIADLSCLVSAFEWPSFDGINYRQLVLLFFLIIFVPSLP